MEFTKQNLYKKDSTGKIRVLSISTEDGILLQESGVVNGKLTERKRVCKPKNVGKANETTAQEQATFEAEAKIKLKLREEYFLTLEEAEEEEVIMPMLAKKFEDQEKNIVYPCIAQPKLDGIRCLAFFDSQGKVTLKTRKNVAIDTMDHIKRALETAMSEQVLKEKGDIILDGELYAHGYSFQQNSKLIRKYRKGESEEVIFHIYDRVSKESYFDRVLCNFRNFKFLVDNHPEIELVPSSICKNREEITKMNTHFLSEGYEGTMVRWGDGGYAINKRSSQLLKLKEFLDERFEVIDVVPSEKDPTHGVVVCNSDNGEFRCGMKFPHRDRKYILRHRQQFIGQDAEVRFFEYTDGGLPRFPVCHGFRLD